MEFLPSTASVADVAQFVKKCGYPDLSQKLVDDKIDGEALYLLEVADWIAYGLNKGPALKWHNSLKQNKAQEAARNEAENTDGVQNGAVDAVIQEGLLLKRGPLAQYGFKAVWALLTPKCLSLYDDKLKATLKTSIGIKVSTQLKRFTSKNAPGAAVSYARERPFGFVLDVDPSQGKDRLLHYFDASDEKSLASWESAFEECSRLSTGTARLNFAPVSRTSMMTGTRTSMIARPSNVARPSKMARSSMVARRSTIMGVRGSISQTDEPLFHLREDQLTEDVLLEHPEYGIITEHAAGSSLEGAEAWLCGRCVVLRGEASIVVSFGEDETETTIASLREQNSFGYQAFEDYADMAANAFMWESNARIVVSDSQPLRLCRLESAAVSEPIQTVGHGRLTELEGNNRMFADLWLHTSAPQIGIGVQPSGRLRTLFLTALWGPLTDRLEEHDDEVRRRKRRGYRTHDQFPLQGYQIAELRDYILHLTEIWYGSQRGGNVSALYQWFLKTMESIGVTAYSMDDIPTETSPDGWAVIVDGSTRQKVLKGRGGQDASYVATGGLKQKQGRSAIDNTVLTNVFTADEARVLLIGRRMRKALCRFIAVRQHCILRRLSIHLQVDLLVHASQDGTGRGHRLVRTILQKLSQEDFKTAGVNPESFCFRDILARGAVLSGFGQLEPGNQKMLWDFASSLLLAGRSPQDVAPKEDSEDVFDRLVLWSRKYPGDFFENDKSRHFEVMLAGMWCNKVILVRRSAMERVTLARYFGITWMRSQPLWAVFAAQGGEPRKLREPGSTEVSKVRANECPYAQLHAMSLPTGGFARDDGQESNAKPKKRKTCSYSLMMEAQWVQDPAGNVENWFLIDIEKILQEAWCFNPHGEKAMLLPGEIYVTVGQNPKIGSSIKQTQHTQLREASLSSCPILSVCSSSGPCRSELLDAQLDFVDIGPDGAAPEACAIWVKVIADQPAQSCIVEFLVELRLRLLAEFGGAEKLDFLVQAVSDESGGFVTLFAPIAQLEKLGDEPGDFASWANPLTGESSENVGLAEARLDFGKAVGQYLCLKPSLRDQLLANAEDTLRRVWAFNRVPGAREFIQKVVEDKGIFK